MKNKRPTIDGFIPRRTGNQLGEFHESKLSESVDQDARKLLHSGDNEEKLLGSADPNKLLGRSDIDESLNQIDDEVDSGPKLNKRQERKALKLAKRPSKVKRIIKWLVILILVSGLSLGAYFATKILLVEGNIFKGSIFDLIQNEPLKEDSNGRSNFLILGTSEDDPGHGGAYLTDSMMVMSVDQKNKNVYMFSIPRDLYVQYGRACNSGYSGKINEYFLCVNSNWDDKNAEEERLTKAREFVGKIFGLDIQYGVHVNNTVIKDAVNAVGGVDVDIQGSNGAKGVLDRNFDWRCRYTCYLVKYDNGVHHLDGEHALYLAMARGDVAPTYGLANSNFDREKNQQKIIIALKDKAASTGTLTNISKVTGLIDALGNNLRTNIEIKEIRTLMKLGTEIKSDNIKTLSLFDGDNKVVTSGPYNGASVVMPVAGIFNYTKIQKFIKDSLSSNPVVLEDAGIAIYNGSNVSGAAQVESDKLTAKDFNVLSVGNAPKGTYDAYEVYVVDETKTATLDALRTIYPAATIKTTKPPVTASSSTSFVIVVGNSQ